MDFYTPASIPLTFAELAVRSRLDEDLKTWDWRFSRYLVSCSRLVENQDFGRGDVLGILSSCYRYECNG